MLNSVFNTLLAANEFINNPGGSIDASVRNNVVMAFMILMMITAIAMIVVVLMQKGTTDNIGVITGVSDTYYGKNKEKTKAGVLKKVTFGLFAFIIVYSSLYEFFMMCA
jgi:preprotein translocase subunit SecG